MTELQEEHYVDLDAEDFLELVYGDRKAWIDRDPDAIERLMAEKGLGNIK